MPDSQKITQLMIQAAESSAKIIRDHFRKDTQATNKSSHQDIVTATDTASQANIHQRLVVGMKALGIEESEIGFIEEESGHDAVRTHNFIVDPIDGTTNFASGIPFCCISIAYALDKDLKIGVVLEPFSQTLYWGEVGNGSFVKNDLFGERRLQLQEKPMNSWIIGAHFNALDVSDQQFQEYQVLYPQIRGMRNMGSLTLDLCLLADNALDGVLNRGCFFWDLAAANIILEEAGGMIYNTDGEKLSFNWEDTKSKYHLIACHPKSKEGLLQALVQ